MASYYSYIGILATRKEVFSVELHGMKIFSKYSEAIAEMESDFTWEVKERDNWQIAGWGKDKIDNLTRSVHDHNAAHQNSKASREAVLRTVASK